MELATACQQRETVQVKGEAADEDAAGRLAPAPSDAADADALRSCALVGFCMVTEVGVESVSENQHRSSVSSSPLTTLVTVCVQRIQLQQGPKRATRDVLRSFCLSASADVGRSPSTELAP